MLAPGQKKTKTPRIWANARDERPRSGQSPPCVRYQFTVDRKGAHPVSHLSGYNGWIHADGYSGFNGLFGDDKAREMACIAHVRRKFVDVFASQGPVIAEEAIRRIADLYAAEKEAPGKPPDERAVLRQSKAKPVFDELEEWLRAQLPRISGKSPLAQAIRCALGRLPKARPYLDNGALELDNHSAERVMKPVAIGRKNWMFAGSEGGGRTMAIAFTLIETAKLNGIDPQAWLTWVLERMADHKISRARQCAFVGWLPIIGHGFLIRSSAGFGPRHRAVAPVRAAQVNAVRFRRVHGSSRIARRRNSGDYRQSWVRGIRSGKRPGS